MIAHKIHPEILPFFVKGSNAVLICGSFVLFYVVMLSGLFIAALWSPAW